MLTHSYWGFLQPSPDMAMLFQLSGVTTHLTITPKDMLEVTSQIVDTQLYAVAST